ncbi:MAG TPA: hypothetical protein VH415_13235 [Nitrososphaeraceae archaeon]
MSSSKNDWISLIVKYGSNCKTCGKSVAKGESAVWSPGLKAIKHMDCHSSDLVSLTSPDSIHNLQLNCTICNRPAGCPECEFEEDCDRTMVSQLCICEKCYKDTSALENYYRKVSSMMPS